MNRSVLWGIALAAAVCAGCASRATPRTGASEGLTEPMAEQRTRAYRACQIDSDCVLALNGCCDCANGGEDIAVNRDQAAAFAASFACSGACNEVGGDCGHGTVRCTDHVCTYEAPTAD